MKTLKTYFFSCKGVFFFPITVGRNVCWALIRGQGKATAHITHLQTETNGKFCHLRVAVPIRKWLLHTQFSCSRRDRIWRISSNTTRTDGQKWQDVSSEVSLANITCIRCDEQHWRLLWMARELSFRGSKATHYHSWWTSHWLRVSTNLNLNTWLKSQTDIFVLAVIYCSGMGTFPWMSAVELFLWPGSQTSCWTFFQCCFTCRTGRYKETGDRRQERYGNEKLVPHLFFASFSWHARTRPFCGHYEGILSQQGFVSVRCACLFIRTAAFTQHESELKTHSLPFHQASSPPVMKV